MSEFYDELDRRVQQKRFERMSERPDNLHDYQGCANDAASRLPAPVSQPVAKEFSYFRCLSCGYSGTITEEEIAKHRERCAHGPTVAVDPSPQAEPSESAGEEKCKFPYQRSWVVTAKTVDEDTLNELESELQEKEAREDFGYVCTVSRAASQPSTLPQSSPLREVSNEIDGVLSRHRKVVEELAESRHAAQSSPQAQGFEQDVLDALVILKHERAGDITGHHYARLVDQYRQRFGKKEQ